MKLALFILKLKTFDKIKHLAAKNVSVRYQLYNYHYNCSCHNLAGQSSIQNNT